MAPKITEFLTVRGMAKKATKNLVTFSAAPPGDKTCSTLVDEWRVVSTTTTTTICWPGHSSCLESSYRKSVQLALFVIDDTWHSATASHISVWTTSTRNDQCGIACGAIAEASRSLKAIKKCVNHQFSRQNCRNSNLLWQKICCI